MIAIWMVAQWLSCQVCVCGHGFSVDHAMNCTSGGFPTLRNNELRDFTATALFKVCCDVVIEPVLQPLYGESFHYATANGEDEACLDVSVQGFWGNRQQRAFSMYASPI